MSPQYEQTNRLIDQLQAGQHPAAPPDASPEDIELIRFASALAAERPGADEPDPAFLSGLRAQLFGADAAPAPVRGTASAVEDGPLPAWTRGTTLTPPVPSAPANEQHVIPAQVLMERRLSRRSMVSGFAAAAAGLVAGLGLDRLFNNGGVKAGDNTPVPSGLLSATQGRWFAVARLADVKIGEGIPVTMGAVKGILIRTSASEFNALSGVCTHLGCDVGWDPGSHTLFCGCHGSSFDQNGKPLTGAALYIQPARNLPVFSWRIDQDVVYVLA